MLNNTQTGTLGAWEVTRGGDIVVAIVDTGCNYRHADLINNMWNNPGELINGIDDDENGALGGWAIVTNRQCAY